MASASMQGFWQRHAGVVALCCLMQHDVVLSCFVSAARKGRSPEALFPTKAWGAQQLQKYSALRPRSFIHSLLTLIPHPAAGMDSLPQMGKLRHGSFCELELTTIEI